MKRLILLAGLVTLIVAAQESDHPLQRRLPNGRTQADLILESDHEKSLEDATEMVCLAEELKEDLEKHGHNVLSVSAIEKAEKIEKISKRLQKRLRRQ